MLAKRRAHSSEWLRRGMRCLDAAVATLVSVMTLVTMPSVMVQEHDYLFLILIGSLLLPAVGEILGLYQPWRGRSLYTMLGLYALSWMATIALISLLLLAIQSTQSFSRLWMGYAALAVLGSGILTRMTLYTCLRCVRAKGGNVKRVLLIGHRSNITQLESRLRQMPYAGYGIKEAYVDDNSDTFIGAITALTAKCAFERDFDEIWLSYPLSDGEKVRRLSANLIGIPVSVRYFPDLTDIRLLNHRMAQVVGLYSLELNYSPLDSTPLRWLKTIEDRVLGAFIFVLFLPVMLVVAGLIKWKMGGAVIFKQYRHGMDGKRFRIYKFRTMSLHNAKHTQQARFGDPRITPLGAFLRRTSLDELPQLYNVLQGRMSLVGPRPHALDHNHYYQGVIQNYMQRHRVKPGMTGWAQVNGYRGSTDTLAQMQKRVEYDLYYIDNWSLGFDLKILAMTLTRGFLNRQP